MIDANALADWEGALRRARQFSPFLCNALDRQPDLATILAQGDGVAALDFARAAGRDLADTGISLRRERLALSTALAVGDLAGAFPVGQVMTELSSFADRALDRAIAAAIHKRVPDAQSAGMIGIALGKHGACELNYSSDIDPILLYDPETLPRRERDEPGEAAQRYAREIVRLMSDVTDEGYVFRVDLRLRPASEISPLAISLGAALSHYESSALTWERAAFIRARAAAGDIEAGQSFLTAIRPFVWRRSLDFGAIDEISRLTSQIRKTYKGPVQPGPEYNVKQGRGGIREVEFFAQTHQLIHGGRDPSLRPRGTRPALGALAAAGIIADEDAGVLGDCYDRLRVIEHRLQMVNDHQTHTLPDAAAIENVAQLSGYADGAALLGDLGEISAQVAERFDTLIDPDNSAHDGQAQTGGLSKDLRQLGFKNPEALEARIQSWTDGHIRTLKSSAAINAFEAILPSLLEAFAEAPNPGKAILRWETLLTKAPSAINLFRLLEARPGLFEQLVNILTLAEPLADKLGRRPELLDTLFDRSAFDLPGDVAELTASMAGNDPDIDYERKLDRIRIVTGEKRFALGAQLIQAAHDPLEIAEGLARVAEAALSVAARAASEEFASVHGHIAGSEMMIIGLGRFGGGALTHASDLDIVYVFSGAHDQESDGKRPLGATLYYNRLAQRISGAMSVPTAEGALYEVDTRLRPLGAQGPLAVSVESFAKYQREDAWTWEHMALARSRVLVGSPKAKAELDRIIQSVLAAPRDADKLREDVLKMRAEMAAHKPAKGSLDAKLQRGGLVDLEFLVHFLQLREGIALVPDLTAAIAGLVAAGHLSQPIREAHLMMTRLLVAGRLLAPDLEKPSPAAARALAKACGAKNFAELVEKFAAARHSVARNWKSVFGLELEITE
ncbi:bifunctional [glutamine synthetase] adenylyltransferase/[glutamine synthetase]-adenylyl-L-tyrosine phosphorylase [Pontixanthobacter gangjinensis]|uniref:Bifunctional [glutamate--ammonia ligase]-adenylyl-L-tyrosine phosphorylase/[glutamate--ammonia-ligase] adenylyltransferase n=1 Tax=Pontixanthobacter gangjinensis TaxID=1028742 RepID=A0A6I4SJ24_9SPHN|nr:bifunctional [glutamate--ammonia ligase]-adenylyl-L-tyrosine phosphorylase/[glutamate--ammonia-ligase] adenylyltransferase [Pontixanthobacter gangjinensis]MXO55851.1 bifunctional [glutamate--ammonia ligase]-adenylyl-L-tyrosine phosphorylase/[glutamate--ammonia-ligase] adenylyltransferase [Pontixanthobacter gangjinensis]